MSDHDLRVRLAYGEHGLDVDLPSDRTTVVEPTYVDGGRGPARPAARRPAQPGARAAAARPRAARPDRGDLDVRRHPAAAPAPDDPRRARGARGHRRPRRRRGAGRNRHPPRQQRRGDPRHARRRGRRRRARRQPRRARRLLAGLPRTARADVPVFLNREWVDADVRITTGFVEPHFFAGFSGGPKLVAPGLAGLETVLTLHDAKRIGDPAGHLGGVRGQPGPRRHPRRRRGRRQGGLRARRGAQPRAADRRGLRRLAAPRCTLPRARRRSGWRCSRCRPCSTSW